MWCVGFVVCEVCEAENGELSESGLENNEMRIKNRKKEHLDAFFVLGYYPVKLT